jgi:cytochrome d ubiquinol oxidase subunit I
VFAFFVESAFLGLYLFGGEAYGKLVRWFAAFMVFSGSWASAYFILTVNAWMQHPVGYRILPNGNLVVEHLWKLLLNQWLFHEYIHVMGGAVVTGAFMMAGVGALYLITRRNEHYARLFLTMGVLIGFVALAWQFYPSGDIEAKAVAEYQPTKLAAQEGVFDKVEIGAPELLVGQPDMQKLKMLNPIRVPYFLSWLSYYYPDSAVRGLKSFPRKDWPDNVPLVFYSYRIMVGLQNITLGIYGLAALLWVWKRRLFRSRRILWVLVILTPLPFLMNTAGWFTAELGRQPWVVYGVMRTAYAASNMVDPTNVYFTFAGLAGLFLLLSVLYVLLVIKELYFGPEPAPDEEQAEEELIGVVRSTMKGNPPGL